MKIVQYNFGYDSKYMQLCKLSEQINKKYCQLHRYDYQFDYLDEQIVKDLYGGFNWNLAALYKLNYMYDILMKDDCDYLVTLDADAAINKPQIKLEDLIDDQHDLFLSRGNEKIWVINILQQLNQNIVDLFQNHRDYLTNYNYEDMIEKNYNFYELCEIMSVGSVFFNEGFFIVKNTPLMKEYFKDCMNLIQYYTHRTIPRGKCPEGLIMCFLFKQQKYKDCYTFMYDQAQGGLANGFEQHYDQDKTFVVHNYGQALTLDQKIDQFKKIKENKWWKDILK